MAPPITRKQLETPRSPAEMRAFVSSVEHDRATYPDAIVIGRKGPLNDFSKEYVPLLTLVENLQNVDKAHLLPDSNKGPDAIIRFTNRTEISVQITVANESEDTGKHRKMLNQERTASVYSEKEWKDKKSTTLVDCGRGIRAPGQLLRQEVTDIIEAIKDKSTVEKFYPETDALLIWTEVRRFRTTFPWREELKAQFKNLGAVPYPFVYVANGNELITLKLRFGLRRCLRMLWGRVTQRFPG